MNQVNIPEHEPGAVSGHKTDAAASHKKHFARTGQTKTGVCAACAVVLGGAGSHSCRLGGGACGARSFFSIGDIKSNSAFRNEMDE